VNHYSFHILDRDWGHLTIKISGHPPFPAQVMLQADFVKEIVDPVRTLAGRTIDAEAIILGLALPGRVSDRVAAAYEEHLFGTATLQELADAPRFVFNATNVQSGALWRFMKPYMRD